MDVIGAKPKVRFLERLPVAAELEDVAPVRLQVGIAAGDRGNEHGLAGGEIENPRAGRVQHRIAELVDRRRALLAASSW